MLYSPCTLRKDAALFLTSIHNWEISSQLSFSAVTNGNGVFGNSLHKYACLCPLTFALDNSKCKWPPPDWGKKPNTIWITKHGVLEGQWLQKQEKWGGISGGLRVRIRVRVDIRIVNATYGYKWVSHNYWVLLIIKIGPSEAVIEKHIFLRCDSHSGTDLSGILLIMTGQTLPG